MKIIIEGPSLTGKDIISCALQDAFNLTYLGTSKHRIPEIKGIDEYSFLRGSIESTLKHVNLLDNIITTKFFIDNVVSNIITNKSSLKEANDDFLNYLDTFHSTHNPVLIVINSTYDTYLKRHDANNKCFNAVPSIKEEMKFQHYTSLMNLYSNKCENKFKILRYSNDLETYLPKLVNTIITDLQSLCN